ncbi:MAG: hypothetical protein ACFFG0_20065 [Candidatus Thorarchaeota archaeon]
MSKIQDFLDKQFHQILSSSHFFYTVIFVISSILIAFLSLIPSSNVGNAIIFLATTFSITFILLMFEGLIPQLEKYLFSTERKFDKNKLICFVINYFIAFFIILPYFLVGNSNELMVQFLGWDIALPVIFITIYFGWNLVQIFYLRIGFDNASFKVNDKINNKFGISRKKELIDISILVIALFIPFLIQLGTFLGFLPEFTPQPGDPTDPLIWYATSNLFILLILIITSWRLITLFQRSRKNDSSNSYSSLFYILIWLTIWFRTFSFFNALQGVTQVAADLEVLTRLIDILLMIITAFLVLKSLGDKVYDSILFKKNNIAFFLFAFTLIYIEGQIILITGAGSLTGVFANRDQINLINNFSIIIITISFYWWYSEHSLERKGYIIKKRFYPEDIIVLINDFKKFLETKDALDTNKIGEAEVQDFLDSKKIVSQIVEAVNEKPGIKDLDEQLKEIEST